MKWAPECEAAFQEQMKYLSDPPLLAKMHEGESLFIYLSITCFNVSVTLIVEGERA